MAPRAKPRPPTTYPVRRPPLPWPRRSPPFRRSRPSTRRNPGARKRSLPWTKDPAAPPWTLFPVRTRTTIPSPPHSWLGLLARTLLSRCETRRRTPGPGSCGKPPGSPSGPGTGMWPWRLPSSRIAPWTTGSTCSFRTMPPFRWPGTSSKKSETGRCNSVRGGESRWQRTRAAAARTAATTTRTTTKITTTPTQKTTASPSWNAKAGTSIQ
mmetsp:Transcript_5100/g.12532  ORF Transcript_5100/g.12532 Transcript_5100/m.12532 type:complete len:211 (+) Transcript_5100:189-821(+)